MPTPLSLNNSSLRPGLTLFAVPKACVGHNALIQENAFGSWAAMTPRPDVILFGDEAGIAEAAARHGFTHAPHLERNEFGTPLLDHIFQTAQAVAKTGVMAYVNSDIILLDDFAQACGLARQTFDSFLLVGRRWDHVQLEPLNFTDPCWRQNLSAAVAEHAYRHWEAGIDYFAFPPGQYPDFPPFAIGRPAWDNWLVGSTTARGIPLVDGTAFINAIHQHHDYNHVSGGRQAVWRGIEAARNRELWRNGGAEGLISSAEWELTPEGDAVKRGSYVPSFQANPAEANAHYAGHCLRQARYLLGLGQFRLAEAKLEETKNYDAHHPEIGMLKRLLEQFQQKTAAASPPADS